MKMDICCLNKKIKTLFIGDLKMTNKKQFEAFEVTRYNIFC